MVQAINPQIFTQSEELKRDNRLGFRRKLLSAVFNRRAATDFLIGTAATAGVSTAVKIGVISAMGLAGAPVLVTTVGAAVLAGAATGMTRHVLAWNKERRDNPDGASAFWSAENMKKARKSILLSTVFSGAGGAMFQTLDYAYSNYGDQIDSGLEKAASWAREQFPAAYDYASSAATWAGQNIFTPAIASVKAAAEKAPGLFQDWLWKAKVLIGMEKPLSPIPPNVTAVIATLPDPVPVHTVNTISLFPENPITETPVPILDEIAQADILVVPPVVDSSIVPETTALLPDPVVPLPAHAKDMIEEIFTVSADADITPPAIVEAVAADAAVEVAPLPEPLAAAEPPAVASSFTLMTTDRPGSFLLEPESAIPEFSLTSDQLLTTTAPSYALGFDLLEEAGTPPANTAPFAISPSTMSLWSEPDITLDNFKIEPSSGIAERFALIPDDINGSTDFARTLPITNGYTLAEIATTDVVATPPLSDEELQEKIQSALEGKTVRQSTQALMETAFSPASSPEEAAQKAQAVKDLAFRALHGQGGIPKNPELGVALMQAAAAADNVQAKVDMAYITYHGLYGVDANPAQAMEQMNGLSADSKVAQNFVHEWTHGSKPRVAAVETVRTGSPLNCEWNVNRSGELTGGVCQGEGAKRLRVGDIVTVPVLKL